MRTFRHFLLVVAVLFILVAQNPGHPVIPDGDFQEFTLTLATPKTKYVEFEPLPIVITLKNETEKPIMGHTVLNFASSYVHLYVDGGDGPREIRQLSILRANTVPSAHEFKPGEEVKATEHLNLRLNEVFPKPGTYQLHARLVAIGGKETVSSKPIEVEIVQPDALDAHALKFIRDNADPALFFTGLHAATKAQQLQVLENFVAVFGQSSYADEASFLLGEVQFAKHEYQKARANFERLSKKSDYAFAENASEYVKRIEREEQKREHP
jgi:hypothetical protein